MVIHPDVVAQMTQPFTLPYFPSTNGISLRCLSKMCLCISFSIFLGHSIYLCLKKCSYMSCISANVCLLQHNSSSYHAAGSILVSCT